MAEVVKNNFETFKFLFNRKDGERPIGNIALSFKAIDGKKLVSYESKNDYWTERRNLKLQLPTIQINKKIKIVEPEPIYYYDFFVDTICSSFNTTYNCIEINELKLEKRESDTSWYSVDATIYPRALESLYGKFSLPKLYMAYLMGDNVDQNLIKNYLNKLRFTVRSSFDICSFTDKAYELDRHIDTNTIKDLRKVLDEASLNTNIINNFNSESKEINIDFNSGIRNYVDGRIKEKEYYSNKNKNDTISAGSSLKKMQKCFRRKQNKRKKQNEID